jgi:hypothetical protein
MLQDSIDQRAVVFTTPSATKSIFLRYLEILKEIRDTSVSFLVPIHLLDQIEVKPTDKPDGWKPTFTRSSAMYASKVMHRYEDMADEVAGALELWRGKFVAVIDEVDWVLHPLKSELNFPTGERELLGPADRGQRWRFPAYLLDAISECVAAIDAEQRAVPERKSAHDNPEFSRVLEELKTELKNGLQARKLSKSPHLILLAPDWYDLQLRRIIAKLARFWLLQQEEIRKIILRRAGRSLPAKKGEKSGDKEILNLPIPQDERLDGALFEFLVAGGRENAMNAAQKLQEELEVIPTTGAGSGGFSLRATFRFGKEDQIEDEKDPELVPLAIQLLNLARLWVTSLLPHCLSKRNRVDYGLINEENLFVWAKEAYNDLPADQKRHYDPYNWSDARLVDTTSDRIKVAVPFEGRDKPSKASEFASPEILLGLTLLSYRYEGIPEKQFRTVLEHLKKKMQTEPGPYRQRDSRRLFDSWVREAQEMNAHLQQKSVLPLELIELSDPNCIADALAVLTKYFPISLYFLDTLVFKNTLRQKPAKLQASGIDLSSESLFSVRIGFTGTASDLLPDPIDPVARKTEKYEKGTEAEIINQLTDPHKVDLLGIKSEWRPETLLERVASASPPFHALIDTGALITGFSNLRRGSSS